MLLPQFSFEGVEEVGFVFFNYRGCHFISVILIHYVLFTFI